MGEDIFAEAHRLGRRKAYGCLGTFVVWSLCMSLIFTGQKWLSEDSAVSYMIGCLVLLICPAVGILQAISLKDYFEWSEKKTPLHWLSWFLIFIGSWLFGWVALACALMGVFAMIKTFEAGQWPNLIGMSVLTMGLGAVALYLLLLPFKRFSRETEKQDRLDEENYESELSHPRFSEIEKQTQTKLPALYQSLFAIGSEWLHPDVCLYPLGVDNDDELYIIDRLIPANERAIRQTPHLPGNFLAFAGGDCEEFWIQLGQEDPAVYTYDLDSGNVEKICERLSVFLSWPRS